MRRAAAAWLVLAALATSACATHRLDEPALSTETGREAAALLARVSLEDDPALLAYLTDLGRGLGGASVTVHVVRDPTLALFALPDGHVFVHTGLLAAMDDEAQLAAVLAHEIAHVLAGDALEAGEPRPPAPSLGGGAAASPTARVIHALDLRLVARAAMTGYGRRRERAADAASLAVIMRRGWDPSEAPIAYERLAARAAEDEGREVFLLGNRHRLAERVESCRPLVTTMLTAMTSTVLRKNSEAFARVWPPLLRANGEAEMRRGDFARAQPELERALAAAPDDARSLLALGDLHRLRAQRAVSADARAVDLALAHDAYARVLTTGAAPADVHRRLGLLYYDEREPVRAREELERYLALAPGAADAPRIAEYLQELTR
ncbi:MAG TPA: M48 family metalloprotease [Methylomirabilota bacterium]|nr:M48 family metalloprotease [Methylomirabilota bacterium]